VRRIAQFGFDIEGAFKRAGRIFASAAVNVALPKTIVKIGKPAVKPLLKLLQDKSSAMRAKAALLLGEIKDDSAVDPLIGCLNDKDRDVRKSAITALGMLCDKRAVEPLLAKLSDPDEEIRSTTLEALRRMSDIVDVAQVRGEVKGNPPFARKAIAILLGQMDDPQAVELLAKLACDKREEVRLEAIKMLALKRGT